jgi:ATP-dependent Clp protease adaptor protein ClpS
MAVETLVEPAECATIGTESMAGKPKDGDRDRDVGTLTRPAESPETVTKKKLERPPLYEVLLHNDDYTTQEFVVYVLMKYFQHDGVTARKIMLHVHTKGIGVAGIYPFEVAETKAHQVVQFARENEMPLQASLRKSQEEG